jgi:hypothetical protein
MDNVQKHNICTNVPSSQTFRYYTFVQVSSCFRLSLRAGALLQLQRCNTDAGQVSGSDTANSEECPTECEPVWDSLHKAQLCDPFHRHSATMWQLHGAVLLEKLRVAQLGNKIPAFYGSRQCITMVTRDHYWSLTWRKWIQSQPPTLSV